MTDTAEGEAIARVTYEREDAFEHVASWRSRAKAAEVQRDIFQTALEGIRDIKRRPFESDSELLNKVRLIAYRALRSVREDSQEGK